MGVPLATEHDPGGRRPWRAGAWAGWVGAVAVQVVLASILAGYILFGASTTCRKVGTSANLTSGQRDLAIVAGLLAIGWIVAALCRPARWARMLLGWLLGIVPLIAVAATHTQPTDWSGSFCF